MKKMIAMLVAGVMLLTLSSAAFAASEVGNTVYGTGDCEAKLGDKSCLPKDVSKNSPSASTISYVISSGMMATDAQGNFRPNEAVQMDEAVTILLRLLGMPPADAKGDSSASAVDRAVQLGWIAKDADVSESVSRLQYILILAQALGVQASDASMPFTDTGDMSVLEQRILAALYKAKLIEGTSDTTFTPNSLISRYELALIIERVLKTYK